MGKKAMGGGEQPARCIVSPRKTIYITRTRIHTHTRGGTSSNVLSVLLFALVAITALCTNYSAVSRKCVVGKATRLATLLIRTCQRATCVLSMCAGTIFFSPLLSHRFPSPLPRPHRSLLVASLSQRACRQPHVWHQVKAGRDAIYEIAIICLAGCWHWRLLEAAGGFLELHTFRENGNEQEKGGKK